MINKSGEWPPKNNNSRNTPPSTQGERDRKAIDFLVKREVFPPEVTGKIIKKFLNNNMNNQENPNIEDDFDLKKSEKTRCSDSIEDKTIQEDKEERSNNKEKFFGSSFLSGVVDGLKNVAGLKMWESWKDYKKTRVEVLEQEGEKRAKESKLESINKKLNLWEKNLFYQLSFEDKRELELLKKELKKDFELGKLKDVKDGESFDQFFQREYLDDIIEILKSDQEEKEKEFEGALERYNKKTDEEKEKLIDAIAKTAHTSIFWGGTIAGLGAFSASSLMWSRIATSLGSVGAKIATSKEFKNKIVGGIKKVFNRKNVGIIQTIKNMEAEDRKNLISGAVHMAGVVSIGILTRNSLKDVLREEETQNFLNQIIGDEENIADDVLDNTQEEKGFLGRIKSFFESKEDLDKEGVAHSTKEITSKDLEEVGHLSPQEELFSKVLFGEDLRGANNINNIRIVHNLMKDGVYTKEELLNSERIFEGHILTKINGEPVPEKYYEPEDLEKINSARRIRDLMDRHGDESILDKENKDSINSDPFYIKESSNLEEQNRDSLFEKIRESNKEILDRDLGGSENILETIDRESVPSIKDLEVEVPKGQGAIKTFQLLQEKLEEQYNKGKDPMPALAQKLLSASPEDLAKEYGFYNPNDPKESAMMLLGDKFHISENGLEYIKADGTELTLEDGKDLVAPEGQFGDRGGEMFDSNPDDIASQGEVTLSNSNAIDLNQSIPESNMGSNVVVDPNYPKPEDIIDGKLNTSFEVSENTQAGQDLGTVEGMLSIKSNFNLNDVMDQGRKLSDSGWLTDQETENIIKSFQNNLSQENLEIIRSGVGKINISLDEFRGILKDAFGVELSDKDIFNHLGEKPNISEESFNRIMVIYADEHLTLDKKIVLKEIFGGSDNEIEVPNTDNISPKPEVVYEQGGYEIFKVGDKYTVAGGSFFDDFYKQLGMTREEVDQVILNGGVVVDNPEKTKAITNFMTKYLFDNEKDAKNFVRDLVTDKNIKNLEKFNEN